MLEPKYVGISRTDDNKCWVIFDIHNFVQRIVTNDEFRAIAEVDLLLRKVNSSKELFDCICEEYPRVGALRRRCLLCGQPFVCVLSASNGNEYAYSSHYPNQLFWVKLNRVDNVIVFPAVITGIQSLSSLFKPQSEVYVGAPITASDYVVIRDGEVSTEHYAGKTVVYSLEDTRYSNNFSNSVKIEAIRWSMQDGLGLSILLGNASVPVTDVSINFEAGKTLYLDKLFQALSRLRNVRFSSSSKSWRRVQTMEDMFFGCVSLETVDWGSSEILVPELRHLFYNCVSLENIDLSNFRFTEETSVGSLFYNCSSLTHVKLHESVNIIHKNNCFKPFTNCRKLKRKGIEGLIEGSAITNSFHEAKRQCDAGRKWF